eukprot:6187687-Pleurochrysis_carterae.AAC.1
MIVQALIDSQTLLLADTHTRAGRRTLLQSRARSCKELSAWHARLQTHLLASCTHSLAPAPTQHFTRCLLRNTVRFDARASSRASTRAHAIAHTELCERLAQTHTHAITFRRIPLSGTPKADEHCKFSRALRISGESP